MRCAPATAFGARGRDGAERGRRVSSVHHLGVRWRHTTFTDGRNEGERRGQGAGRRLRLRARQRRAVRPDALVVRLDAPGSTTTSSSPSSAATTPTRRRYSLASRVTCMKNATSSLSTRARSRRAAHLWRMQPARNSTSARCLRIGRRPRPARRPSRGRRRAPRRRCSFRTLRRRRARKQQSVRRDVAEMSAALASELRAEQRGLELPRLSLDLSLSANDGHCRSRISGRSQTAPLAGDAHGRALLLQVRLWTNTARPEATVVRPARLRPRSLEQVAELHRRRSQSPGNGRRAMTRFAKAARFRMGARDSVVAERREPGGLHVTAAPRRSPRPEAHKALQVNQVSNATA